MHAQNRTHILLLMMLLIFLTPQKVMAESVFTLGVWANYSYLPGDKTSQDTWGRIGDEAAILYAQGQADENEGTWSYGAELRIGPGSFTDPENNSTGDRIALHEAWAAWQLTEHQLLVVGKNQVPFGWKTVNFWPGDIHLAGFGDQMDVGVRLSGNALPWRYDVGFYLADDWGTSTDTVDDNRHWGSTDTFRKVRTWVGNLVYNFGGRHALGFSIQAGKLQDLTDIGGNKVDGDHRAAAIHYQSNFDNFYTGVSYISMQRHLPTHYLQQAQLPDSIENQRLAGKLGYEQGKWNFYVDLSLAEPDSSREMKRIYAAAPGFRYDYGPGWIYVEYLYQTGDLNRDGMVVKGHFDAVYVTVDFYL